MIVIHIDTMQDTARLKRLYDGLENVTLLYNATRESIENELRHNDDKLVMCLGHGTSRGLFSGDWSGYVIDWRNADLLKDRNVIGIWCYASDFAANMGLHGYFTSMFISNQAEAVMCGYDEAEEGDIFNEIDVFCDSIRNLVDDGTAMDSWVPILQENCHKEKGFVAFNYAAMKYFD